MRHSVHTQFFHSLKQVEKRMKLENSSQSNPHQAVNSNTSADFLGSPIYLNLDKPFTNSNSISSLQDSEPPQEFLSNPPEFQPTLEDPSQSVNVEKHGRVDEAEKSGIDDIELLMQLLGLSNYEDQEERERVGLELIKYDCDDGFLGRVAGIKGPKCGKEVGRLEGWIKHFLNSADSEQKREPLRLAHVLFGKAAFLAEGNDGYCGFKFPSTVDEFLQFDPPTD